MLSRQTKRTDDPCIREGEHAEGRAAIHGDPTIMGGTPVFIGTRVPFQTLFDECLPRRLSRDLVGHEARTVPAMGWPSRKNGDLLTVAQGQFDVFLTVDRNLSVQQEVSKFTIAVVVLVAESNRLAAFNRWCPISSPFLAPFCRAKSSRWVPNRPCATFGLPPRTMSTVAYGFSVAITIRGTTFDLLGVRDPN
jgi:hypothetical protein